MPDNNQDTTTQITNPTQTGTVPAPQATDSSAQPASASAPIATSVPPVATATPADAAMPADSPIVDPLLMSTPPAPTELSSNIHAEVAKKIGESHNVLIALSSDPSVDEMCSAIGLSLFLDKLGKRATAIYSGTTPNALEFLKPEDTFEPSADTLQDFVIAINKDKADHLRYKLDGDYVKIYITPYKTRIAEEDLEFSYGDYNVDLVLALDISNGIDLDSALREHGRIMHDAVIINITTGNPGKFGEIEWSDKNASSVSEMIADLLYSINTEVKIDKDEATAFLTGIVAATERFSNSKTTPDTMRVSSRLMESGANQQLISKNITPDLENEMFSLSSESPNKKHNDDPTKLDIEHDAEDEHREDNNASKEATEEKELDNSLDTEGPSIETTEPDTDSTQDTNETDSTTEDDSLLDDLKAAENTLSQAGAETVQDISSNPALKIENGNATEDTSKTIPEENSVPELPTVLPPTNSLTDSTDSQPEDNGALYEKGEKTVTPSADFAQETSEGDIDRYGQMLKDAIEDTAPTEATPIVSTEPVEASNPASSVAPSVPSNPEINGVPEINYMPLPGTEVLPPPPAPPINLEATAIPPEQTPSTPEPTPSAPTEAPQSISDPSAPLGPQPSMQDQVYGPQASDPSAFKIPGM